MKSKKTKAYWMKVVDNKCPICGTLLEQCHIGDYCPKDKCPYVDGWASLTEEQALKLKDKIIF